MNHQIRNVSELELALQSLNTGQKDDDIKPNKESDQYSSNQKDDQNYNSPQQHQKSSTKSRLSSTQYNSNTLLYNISGHITTTNNKLDMLVDAQLRTQQEIRELREQQSKQIELLHIIARNTAVNNNNSSPQGLSRQNTGSIQGYTVKTFGFNNTQDVIAELILKLFKQVEIQIHSRGLAYRTTRVIEQNMMRNAVKVACDSEFKDPEINRKPIKMPKNDNEMAVKLAKKIGSVEGLNPVLDANSLRELFNDYDCRTLMSIIQDIIERIRIIAIIIPFYEADIIKAISFPYFDTEGRVLCEWEKIRPRNETHEEGIVMETSITNRIKIGGLIAKRVPLKTALTAVISESR